MSDLSTTYSLYNIIRLDNYCDDFNGYNRGGISRIKLVAAISWEYLIGRVAKYPPG